MTAKTSRTTTTGFDCDASGRIKPGSHVTGPTDPESAFEGRLATLTAVRMDQVVRGMVIGRFAQWHFGGRQTLNLCSTAMVDSVVMKAIWEGHRYRGQEVTVSGDGMWVVDKADEILFEVTFP